jgi:hypothetical protein
MGNIFSKLNLPGLVSSLAELGVNITGKQYEYMKWRMSDEGKKSFKQEDDNRFYEALAKGDTTVMDLEIKARQEEIDGLLGELGPLSILIACLFLAGCTAVTIPKERPLAHPESLLMNEKSYIVRDMKVKTPNDGDQVLKGEWHVVSPEFIKVHRSNQDNLLAALKALKKARNNVRWWQVCVGAGVAAGLMIGYRAGIGKVK